MFCREEKVKARILRIFKIWEQRGVYGEEFIADLSGLISASPIGQKLNQDPQDFQVFCQMSFFFFVNCIFYTACVLNK